MSTPDRGKLIVYRTEDGKGYQTKHYNLHMILAVGYRVRSPRGTQFRQWATAHLAEYLVKGFVMDDERIKAGGSILTERYFEEQLQQHRINSLPKKHLRRITARYFLLRVFVPSCEPHWEGT